jgi:hypothetical protein
MTGLQQPPSDDVCRWCECSCHVHLCSLLCFS